MNENSFPFRVERLSEHNMMDMITVFKDVFNKISSEEFIKNKYATDYLGVKYIGCLAYNNDGYPIAFFGAIPYLIEYNGQVQLAAQACDAMTHPKYNGRGIFVYLVKQTEKLLESEGIRLIYGWPNQRSSLFFFKKLNWQKLGTMQRFHIPVKTLPLQRISHAIGARWFYNKYKNVLLARYYVNSSDFISSVIDDDFGGVQRNKEYFNYKRKLGSEIYCIAGCKIWMKVKGQLLIGDIEPLSEEILLNLIVHLKKVCFWLGIREIIFQCSPGCYLDTIFSKHFTAYDSWETGGKVLGHSIPLENLRFTYGDLDTF